MTEMRGKKHTTAERERETNAKKIILES